MRKKTYLPIKIVENIDKPKIVVMSVFAHPDDEAVLIGGTIAGLSSEDKIKTINICLTRGEKGATAKNVDKGNLSTIREKEYLAATKRLGYDQTYILPFFDSGLLFQKKTIKQKMNQLFKKHSPDVIITFERTGAYGHSDHIVVSECVTDILTHDYHDIRYFQVTFPKILFYAIDAINYFSGSLYQRPSYITGTSHRVLIKDYALTRLNAALLYKSQFSSKFVRGLLGIAGRLCKHERLHCVREGCFKMSD